MLDFLKDKQSAPWWLLVIIEILKAIINILQNM